jgi:3',5'-cyclic AMP phosphodiesterase CpdA
MTQEDDQSMQVARGSQNTHRPGYIPARILWPALGFPAVIAPDSSPQLTDATNQICVLLLSKRTITPRQAAAHLRVVPWDKRHARTPEAGTHFEENEFIVRSDGDRMLDDRALGITRLFPLNDEHAMAFDWGYDLKKGDQSVVWQRTGITGGLSKFVLNFYTGLGYRHLYEIRVTKEASGKLGPGLYNLYWINANRTDTEDNISDEMRLLIDKYAKPLRDKLLETFSVRFADDAKLSQEVPAFLMKEYEFDYGALHPPYNKNVAQPATASNRTEVLHPLFVWKQSNPTVRFAQLTDVHVDTRNDVYEDNLRQIGFNVDGMKVEFNNWNTSFVDLYRRANDTDDVLLLTGDLIDYGRGHWGQKNANGEYDLGDDQLYHNDRNWFLFYYLFASGEEYKKPSYTILGNHDWRINPYTPFAIAGAPTPRSQIHNYMHLKLGTNSDNEWGKRLRKVIQLAHGPGYEKVFAYGIEARNELELLDENPDAFWKTAWDLLQQTRTMNVKGAPSETTIDSVTWYLLLINPFLDFSFRLPGAFEFLMLDWAEDEDVLFPIVEAGVEHEYRPWEADSASYPGPMAKECLTDLQKKMVEEFIAKPGRAKVIGIHAPPISPYSNWTDDMLNNSELRANEPTKTRGSVYMERISPYPNGKSETWYGHRFLAIRPKDGMAGQEADYNSFVKQRDWFIQRLHKQDAHVALVLSGHIHRNSVYVIRPQPTPTPNTMLIARKEPGATPSWRNWEVSLKDNLLVQRLEATSVSSATYQPPLYVNTTSGGPRGNFMPKFPVNKINVEPGFAEFVVDNAGKVQLIKFRSAETDAIEKHFQGLSR